VLTSIDTEVDPCDDFYQFACGTWKATHVIPEDETIISPVYNLVDDVALVLKSTFSYLYFMCTLYEFTYCGYVLR